MAGGRRDAGQGPVRGGKRRAATPPTGASPAPRRACWSRPTAAHQSRLEAVRGDTKYRNRALDAWLESEAVRYVVEVIERPPGSVGYVKLPKRWVVERTLAWLSKCRGLLIRYDKHDENYLGLIQLACGLLWYRRLHKLKAA